MVRASMGDLMHRTIAMVGALCLVPTALAQDSAARNLASACAICHGTDGRPVTKDVIPLAGLPREHIAKQMRAFREGQRPATVMHQIAKGYSDAQIDAIAGWYAAQKR
jgi:cytochrome subunit of sulfide dehydrogenase